MTEEYKKEMIVPNDTNYLSDVRELVSCVLDQTDFENKTSRLIVLAVDEAVANIMEHATDNNLVSDIKIDLSAESDHEKFRVVIKDSGKRFDPTGLEQVDVKSHLKQGKKHGLGIFLIRQIMDEVQYCFKKGSQNELSMIKYFNKPS